jgi:hypothetical protein
MRDGMLRRLDNSSGGAHALHFSWRIRHFAATGHRGDWLHGYWIEMAHGQDQGWGNDIASVLILPYAGQG